MSNFISRLSLKYNEEIKDTLISEFKINPMQASKIEKIIISVGVGFALKDTKMIQNIADTISLIAGQKAIIIKSRKSVASFKVREGMATGIKVTLRGQKMYNFLDKLISVSLPKMKDFRGISANGFDGRGNFSFGLDEQLIFPEVVYDNILRTHGMNINIVTTTSSDKQTYRMLQLMGFPFSKGKNNG
jgi:large subunit ribosomal protein L5